MNVLLLEERYLIGETVQRLIQTLPAIRSVRRVPDVSLAAYFCDPDFPDIVFADFMLFSELERSEKSIVERMRNTCGIVVYSPVVSENYRKIALEKGADLFVRIGDLTIMMDSIFTQVTKKMIAKKLLRQSVVV